MRKRKKARKSVQPGQQKMMTMTNMQQNQKRKRQKARQRKHKQKRKGRMMREKTSTSPLSAKNASEEQCDVKPSKVMSNAERKEKKQQQRTKAKKQKQRRRKTRTKGTFLPLCTAIQMNAAIQCAEAIGLMSDKLEGKKQDSVKEKKDSEEWKKARTMCSIGEQMRERRKRQQKKADPIQIEP